MGADSPLVPEPGAIVLLTADNEARHADVAVAATRGDALIRRWAEQRNAQPGTALIET